MSDVNADAVERVAAALRMAEETNGADNELDHYMFQAHAAIRALGLTEEWAVAIDGQPCGRRPNLSKGTAESAKREWDLLYPDDRRGIVTRLVGPWRRVDEES